MNLSNCTPQSWIENEENFTKQLLQLPDWSNIPLLNVNELHNLKDSTLVRFRGMIQDMHGPEYYIEQFEVFNVKTKEKTSKNAKYCDVTTSNQDELVLDNVKNITSERHCYVVISTPGLNDWVKVTEEEKYKLVSPNIDVENKNNKRSFDETMEAEQSPGSNQVASSSNDSQKKARTTVKTNKENSELSTDYVLNFPLPDRTGKKCHLKVYSDAELLKLNESYEFVGFLSMDSIIDTIYEEDDMETRMEIETRHPPSSLVPRIHAVAFKKLNHDNPLLSDKTTMTCDQFNYLKKELLILLTQLLLGDDLAAEYLLYHLISEVYLRKDFMALGKFSLNISNVPVFQNTDFACELYRFIEILMPKSHYLPMTLENMNCLSFTPKKDYECNRLTSGLLQLSTNTHLLLDETKMSAGKLDAAGVNSVKAISSAIKNQSVTYDFNYYPIEYDCDIPFLILSEGKSMFAADAHVVLVPDEVCLNTFPEIVKAAWHFLKPELLKELRMYLTLARLTKYEICESVEQLVQQEFVNMRRKGAVSVDDLHGLLVLARLVSISYGKSTLDEDCWRHACNLEERRRARLPK